MQGVESLVVSNLTNWLAPHHYIEEELLYLYHLVEEGVRYTMP